MESCPADSITLVQPAVFTEEQIKLQEKFNEVKSNQQEMNACLAYVKCKFPDDTNFINYFIDKGANVEIADSLIDILTNKYNEQQQIKIILAAAKDKFFTLCLLLQLGVSANSTDEKCHFTPLLIAIEKKQKDTVERLLIEKELNLNFKSTGTEISALICATYNNNLDIIKLLLADKRTNPNITTINGDTALMIACREGLADVVYELCKRDDIDIYKKNKQGDSAITFAKNTTIIEILNFKKANPKAVVPILPSYYNPQVMAAKGYDLGTNIRHRISKSKST